MSYILEALKKSEKKRQGEQGSLAHLATHEPADQEPQPTRRSLWPLLLGIALVINAGVLLYIFWPAAPQPPSDTHTSALHQSAKTEPPVNGIVAQTEPPSGVVSPPPAGTRETLPLQVEANSAAHIGAKLETAPAAVEQLRDGSATASQPQEPTHTATKVQTLQTAPADAPEPPPAPASPVATPEQSAPAIAYLNELPLSFRTQLPEMHMSVHVYTGSPQTGVVRINENMLRPGDYLDNRLLLEEITPDGAVFSYLGQWFLLPRRH